MHVFIYMYKYTCRHIHIMSWQGYIPPQDLHLTRGIRRNHPELGPIVPHLTECPVESFEEAGRWSLQENDPSHNCSVSWRKGRSTDFLSWTLNKTILEVKYNVWVLLSVNPRKWDSSVELCHSSRNRFSHLVMKLGQSPTTPIARCGHGKPKF